MQHTQYWQAPYAALGFALALLGACAGGGDGAEGEGSAGGGASAGQAAPGSSGQGGEAPGGGACPPDPVPVSSVDLLLVIDNSGSMRGHQAALAEQMPRIFQALLRGDRDLDGEPDFQAVQSVQVGVVSSDMGLVGISAIPGCVGLGDDGVLQAVVSTDPACAPSYPAFLTYDAGDLSSEAAVDAACITALGSEGCGFEQQLEAMLKALWPSHDVDPATGSVMEPNRVTFLAGPDGTGALGHGDTDNRGFLRRDPREGRSLLAVLMLTDEEDCSSADTSHFVPDLFLQEGDPLREQDLNLRCFFNPQNLYPIARYENGLEALRPGAEHLIVYGLIAGVPLETADAAARAAVDWDDAASRDAFYRTILDHPQMQELPDPTRTVEQGGNLTPSCDWDAGTDGLGRAYPPRRMVTLAQELGARGSVGSLCQNDLSDPIEGFLDALARNLEGATDPGIPGVCDPILDPPGTSPPGATDDGPFSNPTPQPTPEPTPVPVPVPVPAPGEASCQGVVYRCSTLRTSTRCRSQQGCRWSTTDSTCSGVASSCFTFYDQFGCTGQEGCLWL